MKNIFTKAYNIIKRNKLKAVAAGAGVPSAYAAVDLLGLPGIPRHKMFMKSIFDYQNKNKSMNPIEYAKAWDQAKGDTAIERMNSMRGKVTMNSTDGTNCMRAISHALPKTDKRYNYLGKGETVDIYDAINKAKKAGTWHQLEPYADLSKVPENSILISTAGEHATMTAPHNGLIQSGSSRGGIYYAPSRHSDYTGGAVDGYISE